MLIYKITHITSGKVYIGQTIGTLENRWKEHCNGRKQPTSHLHRAINKYTPSAFTIEIIARATALEELNQLEEKFIADYDCLSPKGFNILRGGNNRQHHEETKAILRGKLLGKPIPNRWSKGFNGRHTQETKDKIAAKLKGRPIKNRMNGAPKGRPVLPERRKQISDSLKGRLQPNKYRPVLIVETGDIYESVAATSRAIGLERTNLLHYLKSGKQYKKLQLSFRYADTI